MSNNRAFLKISKRLPIVLLGFLLVITSGCSREYEWRQKLTVTVQTPNGPVSASNVYEVTYIDQQGEYLGEWSRVFSEIRGEAIVLELAPEQYLFVLMRGISGLAKTQFDFKYDSRDIGGWVDAIRDKTDQVVTVSDWTPFLVTFGDVKDPMTIREVDPDDLSASFGPGYALAEVTLEITDEEVTADRIDGVLLWLATVGDGMLDGRSISTIRAENLLANDLTRWDFRRVNE